MIFIITSFHPTYLSHLDSAPLLLLGKPTKSVASNVRDPVYLSKKGIAFVEAETQTQATADVRSVKVANHNVHGQILSKLLD